MAAPPASRWEIFAALAQGLEISRVLARFQLTREELKDLFQEAAAHYREQETGYWTLHCDGASRGNPGPAGAGAVLADPKGKVRLELGRPLGRATNNVAEYQALLLGLEAARDQGVLKLQVFSDSELLVKQLKGQYRVRNPHLLPLWRRAWQELQKFKAYAISHVSREQNLRADRLARRAIDAGPPTEVK